MSDNKRNKNLHSTPLVCKASLTVNTREENKEEQLNTRGIDVKESYINKPMAESLPLLNKH